MGRRPIDLLVVATLAVLAAGAALVGQEAGPWRALLTVPLVLFLPGYALTAAVFPRRGGVALSPAERTALGVGLSLALAAMGGIVLDGTPWGLRAASWAVLLAGITLGATAVALARGAGEGEREAGGGAPRRGLPAVSFGQGLLLAGAALAVVVATAIARQGAEADQATKGSTQLWLVAAGEPGGALRLGLRSAEPRPATYVLRLAVDGVPAQTWPDITLAPGQTWETTVTPAAGGAGAVEAVLARAESPGTVYRRVTRGRGP
jgi:Protein of unknown function (DUF1616)